MTKETTLNEKEKKTTIDDSHCGCCLKPLFIGCGIECNNCHSRSCRKSCSRWDTDDNIWLCLLCHHRRSLLKKDEKWFETIGGVAFIDESINKFNTAKYQVCIAGAEHVALNSERDLAAGGYEERNTMESVRELIENIVENLVGNVDNTPINHLYKHTEYDRLFDEFSTQLAVALTHLAISLRSCITNKPATDTPSLAQTALREIVERAVGEARKLPGLGESVSTTTQNNASIDEQSYEDLLATAILNKVIEKYQTEQNVDDNSNVLHEKSSRTCKHIKDKIVDDVNEDGNSSSVESSMSHDECSSDCSGNKMRKRHVREDSLSLTIEEQIEEITTLYTSDEDTECMKKNVLNFQRARRVPFPEFGMDIVDPSQESSDESHDETDDCTHVDHITPVESWEENWLFQKKKISIQSDPVTMLVPNPNADYRALIGDKDAEDTSDLSEFSAHSDDEVDDELIEAINCVIPKSSASDNIINSSNNENTGDISINTQIIISNEATINTALNKSAIIITPANENDHVEHNNNQFNSELNQCALINSDNSKNIDVPRTPASSPVTNSFYENDSTSTGSCDPEKLNEKLVSIDQPIAESIESIGMCREAMANPATHLTSEFLEQEKIYENNLQLSTPPRPGTIAEREHKKWENAPPIENNPYSQENIQKRLLERQYSKRSSDVNGNSAVLSTSPCPPLHIVIGGNRPDIKRFGRDYYINESKSPTGERPNQSGTSISSRPSSSLSHHSNSTSSDFEQQENFESIEAASKSLEPKQNNHVLERERKNSKNEINAKLNNRGNFDSIATIFDTKKSFTDDNKRQIRRIDLRAYGFENEFNINNEDIKKKQQRIPNKLDLRSYGYDSGLRRTQSNNHIDSKVNNSFTNAKTNSVMIKEKSNLSHQRYGLTTDNDYHWTQSTESLIDENKMAFEKFDRIKSATSVPNIAKGGMYLYNGHKEQSIESNDNNDYEDLHYSEQKSEDFQKIHQNGNSIIDSSTEMINNDAIDSTSDVYNYESDSLSIKTASTDELPQKFATLKEMKYSLESLEDSDTFVDKKLPMPSVKVLAQAFSKPLTSTDKSTPKISRSTGIIDKDRPTTPEIQIIGTPRQMHSLTARSISREFREGLRQITNKPNVPPPLSPTINTAIIEQNKTAAGSTKLNGNVMEGGNNTNAIPPGKLKNNIQFWEEIQKKH